MIDFSAQINNNYNAAINYYSQKRLALETAIKTKRQSGVEDILNYVHQMTQTYAEQVQHQLFNSLNFEKGIVTGINKSLPDNVLGVNLKQLQEFALGHNRRNIASVLGNEFEKFLTNCFQENEIVDVANGIGKNIINSGITSLLNSLGGAIQTGGIKSTSAVVTGSKNIRPDIGIGFSEAQQQGYGVELQQFLDLDQLKIDLETQEIDSDLLKKFLQNSAYGFSLKLWNIEAANNKEFSQSKPIQELLNRDFQTTKYGETRKRRTTWESQYTLDYVNYTLSRYLINIIGPINVALITGGKNSFTWFDDFLNAHMFTMQIQLNSHKKSTRGLGYEGFPEILSPAIIIRKINNLKIYNTSVAKSGKIVMRNRRIVTK